MMEEHNTWIEQLNILQSNIQSLFEGVIKENNNYKEGHEFLSASLKQMLGRIENLERQNEMLRKCNASMRNIINVGLKTFRKLDLSCVNSIRDNKVSLELLQKLFIESSEKIEVKDNVGYKVPPSSGEDKNKTNLLKAEVQESKIIGKRIGFENSSAPTVVKNENEGEREQELELNSPDDILRNLVGKKSQTIRDVKRKLMHQNDASNVEEGPSTICKPAEPPPQINGNVLGSPVFKDARKQDPVRPEEDKSSKSNSLKLINEKFVEKSVQLLISPWKPPQPDVFRSSTSKGQFTPKRGKTDSKFTSPSRSPVSALRRSISREGDSVSPGGKKLTQTFLNIDCFKQKNPVMTKNPVIGEDENKSKRTRLDNVVDDDLIFDSPKRQNQVLENTKKEAANENDSRCLDETFISSPAIRQFNSEHNVEEIIRNQSTYNHPRQKSPECDSVPFVYKREAIRKKEERMKLPGHPCVECDKYYKNALGDLDSNDLEKILNKCSRHRDKNPPALDDTPPGYWKPYLTCSTIYSPNKNDTR